MKVEQIYSLMNDIASEVVGEEFILEADLSNVVQLGDAILNKISYDNYVRTLVNHIGKVDFHNRIYAGGAPSIYKDSWEYGSIREKISFVMPEAEANPSWDLQDGTVYEQDQFKAPQINVKFYNGRTTYQVQLSITERQVKESFSNASQLNSFISGLQVAVENSITIKNDALIMETIDSAIAHVLNAGTSANKVDVLSLYNTKFSKSLTASAAITDPDFIKFASYLIGLYSDRMTRVSTLFNLAGEVRFTPKDKLHVVLLSEFAKAADSYLQSDTFHDEFTALPQAETVPFWQGSGKSYAFDDTSKIDVTVKDITSANPNAEITVEQGGIIGVMFDDWAVGVTNEDRRTTSHVNAVGEFTNYWYKVDAEYFNDNSENFVVFYLGDSEPAPSIKEPTIDDDACTNCTVTGPFETETGYMIWVSPSNGYTLTGATVTATIDGSSNGITVNEPDQNDQVGIFVSNTVLSTEEAKEVVVAAEAISTTVIAPTVDDSGCTHCSANSPTSTGNGYVVWLSAAEGYTLAGVTATATIDASSEGITVYPTNPDGQIEIYVANTALSTEEAKEIVITAEATSL